PAQIVKVAPDPTSDLGEDGHGGLPFIFEIDTTANSHIYSDIAKQFTVQVTDIASGATTGAVSTPVTITDKAPTVQTAPQAPLTVPEGSQATNSGPFIDFDEPMTITASQGTLTDNHDGQWVWTQTGEKSDSGTVTITATNTEGSSTPITFNVEF